MRAPAEPPRAQNVHHAGEAMAGDEDEDVLLGGTQAELAPNARCPLSFRNLLEIEDPVK